MHEKSLARWQHDHVFLGAQHRSRERRMLAAGAIWYARRRRSDDRFAFGTGKAGEQGGDRIADLHLWRVGPGHAAAMLSVVSHHPQVPDLYKRRLEGVPGLAHVTVEVQRCH